MLRPFPCFCAPHYKNFRGGVQTKFVPNLCPSCNTNLRLYNLKSALFAPFFDLRPWRPPLAPCLRYGPVVIDGLMLFVSPCPKVITLCSFQCYTNMVSNIFVFVRQVLLKYFIIYSFARVFNFEKEKAQVTGFNFLRKNKSC